MICKRWTLAVDFLRGTEYSRSSGWEIYYSEGAREPDGIVAVIVSYAVNCECD
jgi:hypothetical protein